MESKEKNVSPDSKQKAKIPIEEMKHEDLVAQVKRQLVFLQKAKAKCDDLNGQILTLQMFRDENESLKDKCTELEVKLKLSEENNAQTKELEDNLASKEIELETFKDNLSKMQKEKSALDEQLQCMSMKNSTLGEMLQSLQQELSVVSQSKEDENKQLLLVTEARDAALSSLKDLKNIINQRDLRISDLESELKTNSDHSNKLLSKFDVLIQEIESLTTQNNSLQDEYNGVKRQLKTALNDCDNWKAKVDELENEKDDYVGPPVDVSELQCKIEELEQELDSAMQDKMQLADENETLSWRVKETEVASAKDQSESTSLSEIKNYLEQIRNLEEDLLKATNQKDDLMDELEQVKDLQRFLEDETKELHEESHSLKDQVGSLEERLSEDSTRLSKLDEDLRQAEDREKEFKHNMSLMELQAEETAKALQNACDNYQEQLTNLQTKLDERDLRANELEKENETLSEIKQEFEAQSETVICLQDQIKALSLSSQNKTDEMKIEEYEKEISILKELLASERLKIEKLIQEAPHATLDEIENSTSDIRDLPRVDATNEEESNTNDLSRKVADLTEALKEKSALVERIHVQMDNLLSQVDDLNEVIAEKETDIQSLAAKLQKQLQDLNEKEEIIKSFSDKGEEICGIPNQDIELFKKQKEELEEKLNDVTEDRQNLTVSYNNLCDHLREMEENENYFIQRLELEGSLREFCTELEMRLANYTLENQQLDSEKGVPEEETIPTKCDLCEESQKEIKVLKDNLDGVSEENTSLKMELKSAETLKTEFETKQEKMSEQIVSFNEANSKVQELEVDKKRLDEEKLELLQKLESNSETLNSKDLLINQLNSENVQLKDKSSSYESDLNSLRENESSLKQKVTDLESKIVTLSKVSEDMDALKMQINNLGTENKALTEALHSSSDVEALLSEIRNEKCQLQNECADLRMQIEMLNKAIENDRRQLEEKESIVSSLKGDLVTQEEQNQTKDEEIGCLRQKNSQLQSENSELRIEKESCDQLKIQLANLELEKATLSEALRSKSDTESVLSSIREEKFQLEKDVSNSQSQVEIFNRNLTEMESLYNSLKTELEQYQEFKLELIEKNKVLVEERDKLNVEVTRINQELSQNENVISNHVEELQVFKQRVEDLDEVIVKAQRENARLNESLRSQNVEHEEKQKSSNNHEDLTKKELNECHDKMDKLKRVIFKLKKDLAESQKLLADAKAVKDELSNLSRSHLQNFQGLQLEYDKLQDDFEALKVKNKKAEQDIAIKVTEVKTATEELENVKSDRNKIQSALESEKQEKKHIVQLKAEQESKVIVLKSEKETERKKVDVSQSQIKKLEADIRNLENKLRIEKDAHSTATDKLEESLKKAKKHEVLNLEINDFETTIYNMEEKIKDKESQITDLQKEIERHGEKELFLKEELEHLNSQRITEEYRFENLKDTLERTKAEVAERNSLEKDLRAKLDDAQNELEKINSVKEESQIQLSVAAQQISSLEQVLKNSKEHFSKSSKTFEGHVSHLEHELSLNRDELETTKKEFEGYKVRVHSVLKQKRAPVTPSPADIEDKERLEKSLEAFKNQLELLNSELNVKKMEMETLQREHVFLNTKIEKLNQEIQRKEENWTSKYDQLVKDKRSSQALWEAERNQLLQQKELLNSNFRIQTETLKEEHQMSVDTFQRQLDLAERELFTFRQREIQQQQSQKMMQSSLHDDSNSFDITTIERQEGEGSECTENLDSASQPYKSMSLITIPSHGFTPLEQLLQSNSEQSSPTLSTDISVITQNLSVAQKKIDHLVELLNESEASNVRFSEQVRLLKDEIRRLERNKEREEIVSNLEYLKNVIIKFITLQEGNERERLVPVLTTMLKLSNEEQSHIQQVASGQYANSANNSGWGSYLQWSGLI